MEQKYDMIKFKIAKVDEQGNVLEKNYTPLFEAIDAALCAGKDILSIYNDPTSDFQIEKKADNSPLTIADKKAHAAIAGYLQKTPYPLLSEEGKHLPYTERCAWTYGL